MDEMVKVFGENVTKIKLKDYIRFVVEMYVRTRLVTCIDTKHIQYTHIDM